MPQPTQVHADLYISQNNAMRIIMIIITECMLLIIQ